MAPVDNHSDHSDEIDLGELLSVLLRGWKLITLVFVGALFLGAVYAFLGPATYEWRSVVQIKESNPVLQRLGLAHDVGIQEKLAIERLEQFNSTGVLMAAVEAAQAHTQVHALNRIPVLGALMARHHEREHEGLAAPFLGLDGFAWGGERVVLEELQLPLLAAEQRFILEQTETGYILTDEDGTVLLDAGVLGQPMEFQFEGRAGRLTVDEMTGRVGTRFKISQEHFSDVLKALKDDLVIESLDVGGAQQYFVVTFRGSDLLGGPAFIDALVVAYVDAMQTKLQALSEDSARELLGRLPSLENNMRVAEQAAQSFKELNPEVRLSSSLKSLLEDSLAVETERAELKLQYDLLSNHYGSDHFLIQGLNMRLAQLRQERDVLDDLLGNHVGLAGELWRLERDAAVMTHLFNTVSDEINELQAAADSGAQPYMQADFNVSPPEVVEPKRALVLAVSGLLGLMLGVFIVLMRAFMRPVIDAPMALRTLTRLNTIAVPDVQSRRSSKRRSAAWRLLIDDQPASPTLESLRALRAAFDGQENRKGTATLAFVGPTADVGKNFVAANAAALLALEGKRVLLIDADMRRSRLHEYLGYEAGLSGLAQLLSGQAAVKDVLIESRAGLTVLPAGGRPANPTELLLQPGFAALLEQLGADYDYVILVTPPILPVADTLAILRHTEAAYLVVRAERTTPKEVRDALERLQTAGVKEVLSGAVLNGVTRHALGQGASYEHYYSYD